MNYFIFQVDLLYPKHLFEQHKDQPLAPELLEIRNEMLGEDAQEFLNKHGCKFTAQKRLAPNFLPKKNYVVHISNLKFYMEQGLILEKVHRGVSFYQSNWLEPYITLNTNKRMQATSDFEKSFFKLLVSS